ncbi:MAG: hypothetical protein PHT98_06080 [Kiritimatiellae bacterium]|nr:hypothetical protein [Kiritimatiellia bacterium]MDD4441360.1 hypothetical protein [Kiritimatiellia bacterium]
MKPDSQTPDTGKVINAPKSWVKGRKDKKLDASALPGRSLLASLAAGKPVSSSTISKGYLGVMTNKRSE